MGPEMRVVSRQKFKQDRPRLFGHFIGTVNGMFVLKAAKQTYLAHCSEIQIDWQKLFIVLKNPRQKECTTKELLEGTKHRLTLSLIDSTFPLSPFLG